MNFSGEQGSRLLDDAAQVCDLLRLAHSAAHRMQRELNGESYEQVVALSQQLHDIRDEANQLFESVQRDVEEMDQKFKAV